MSFASPSLSDSPGQTGNRITALVQLAFRRKLLTMAVDHLGVVFSLIFGGLVFLLLLGTQILSAWVLLALAVTGLAIGWYRVRADMPNRYRLAQVIDRKLGLHDSISTAFFLLSNVERRPPFVVQTQVSRAASLAPSINLAKVFPFAGRRQWIVTAFLLITATALFTTRYLVTNSLDLSLALIPVHFGPVYERVEKLFARSDPKREMQQTGMRRDAASTQTGKDQNGAEERSGQPQDPASAPAASNAANDQSPGELGGAKAAGQPNDTRGDKGNAEGDVKTRDNASPHEAAASGTPSAANKGNSQNDSGQKKESADTKATTGVFEKMRDAASSMMAKMKAASSGQSSSQDSKNQRESQQNAQQSSQKQDQQRGQQGDQSQQSSEDPNSQGQQQGDAAQKAQASEGRTSNSSSNQKGSDSHSGIGTQDGEKALRDARQQDAMGKLAEIIGKRSAELTGDVMVDVPSGKQQLRTTDSGRLGKHSDTGGEINRDQVPLEFQQYVRDYMEQVRKQPAK